MSLRRSLTLAAALATLCSGCTTFNDRFYVPGRDPLMEFLGYEYETTNKLWTAATLPELRPMRTVLIPDRPSPRAAEPFIGWLPSDPSGWPPL